MFRFIAKKFGTRAKIGQQYFASFLLVLLVLVSLTASAVAQKKQIRKGYLLVQQVATYNASKYGAISTPEEAEKIFAAIADKLDGVEFNTLYYADQDIAAHRAIAKVAQKHGVDLWASTFKLLERNGAFGSISPEYQAYVMNANGEIIPAMLNNRPLFDILNPDAVTWFIGVYKQKYLIPCKGLFNGLFFNEDVIPYLAKWNNDTRYDYWNNATYSPAVLKLWRQYCIDNKIQIQGRIVDKFPVHKPDLVANGSGKTAYYPGYNVPEKIFPGQRFIDLPRASGVWKSWYDFIGKVFVDNWIGRMAQAANEVNQDNPNWYGVAYFGLHYWSLPYEEIQASNFTVPAKNRWGAWGRQRGLDLAKLSQLPEVDIIICETYPPIAGNLELFIREYKRIAVSGNKVFGLMLHRDDSWVPPMTEEELRWVVMQRYLPQLIARYPLKNMLPGEKNYSASIEQYFNSQLAQYRARLK